MNAKLKKLVAMLTMTEVLLGLALTNMKIAFSNDTGGEIDLFTQKEPYSGRGPNTASDAFGPGEEVQIYALATYNNNPLQNLLVGFQILGPENPFESITFCRTAMTNESGIAAISFRIPLLNESTFGEWTVVGNARIGDLVFQDSVMFKVSWIVEIVSLRTIDVNYVEQEEFARGSDLGVALVLRNVAMTERIATLTVSIYDCLNILVNSTELSNFVVKPDETLTYAYFFLSIPKNTRSGYGTVHACAFTPLINSDRFPYCPEVSKQFSIVAGRYFLGVKTEPAGIVTIPGQGWYEELANVTLTAPSFVLVSTGARYNFTYWDVDGASKGTGVNSVIVLMDNNHTATAHYIQTCTLTITTTAGGTTDPAPGTYGYTANSTIQVTAIPSASYVLDHWELDDAPAGAANPYAVYMDKNHALKAVFSRAPTGWFVPYWFFWVLLPFLISIIILPIIWLYRRKRRKKTEEAFYSGWTAWYYCYDLRNRTQKI